MCMAWRRLFQIQEIVYKELVIECLATVSSRRKISALEDGNLTFYLGEERQELRLAELVMRIEIYLLLTTNNINQRQKGDKAPVLHVFILWALITTDIYVDIPLLLAEFLSIRAGKDRHGSPLYDGMFITRIAQSFGIIYQREAMFLTIKPQKAFSPLFLKNANIVVDNAFGIFSILNDMPCNQPGRRVRQKGGDTDEDDPPVIPTEDELSMDPYNVTLR
ncbi:unnamed protein product [Lactuca saligna]|uniref:Uncharacterized protein n=1 Tax=Lactuca saligna TaxID=75948 RepID=A0AA35YBJ6_LACSI|nr:unnamed protein product [Lactuca saligna]